MDMTKEKNDSCNAFQAFRPSTPMANGIRVRAFSMTNTMIGMRIFFSLCRLPETRNAALAVKPMTRQHAARKRAAKQCKSFSTVWDVLPGIKFQKGHDVKLVLGTSRNSVFSRVYAFKNLKTSHVFRLNRIFDEFRTVLLSGKKWFAQTSTLSAYDKIRNVHNDMVLPRDINTSRTAQRQIDAFHSLRGSAELGSLNDRPNSLSSRFLGDTVTVAPPSCTDTSRFSMSSCSCSVMPSSLLFTSFFAQKRHTVKKRDFEYNSSKPH